MEDTGLKWHKSTYSSNGGGECIEVGDVLHAVVVRYTRTVPAPCSGSLLTHGAGSPTR